MVGGISGHFISSNGSGQQNYPEQNLADDREFAPIPEKYIDKELQEDGSVEVEELVKRVLKKM